jgi:ribosome-associated translation inhibitor RaiA
MAIQVTADHGINAQARTYAEYRLFTALMHLADIEHIPGVQIVLRRESPDPGCKRVSCAVTVARGGARAIRIRAAGAHAYAAINRVVDRLNELLDREFPTRVGREALAGRRS